MLQFSLVFTDDILLVGDTNRRSYVCFAPHQPTTLLKSNTYLGVCPNCSKCFQKDWTGPPFPYHALLHLRTMWVQLHALPRMEVISSVTNGMWTTSSRQLCVAGKRFSLVIVNPTYQGRIACLIIFHIFSFERLSALTRMWCMAWIIYQNF